MVQVFNFKDNRVGFRSENGVVYANATEMAKPFGKNPGHWLRNQSSQEFINELSALRNRKATDLVGVVNGNNPGTWMHEDVAMEFSRWLSPSFAIWCNDRIKEILKYGFTGTDTAIDNILNDPDFGIKLLTQLKQERAEKQRLSEQNQLQTQQLQISAPKVAYYDQVLTSVSTYVTDQIAKELGLTAISLNKRLKDLKVQFRRNEQWVLTAQHLNKGLTDTRTHPYRKSDGTTGTAMQTVWTEAGRQFIHQLIKM